MSFNAEDIATEILMRVKEEVTKYYQDDEIGATITVPANFAVTAVQATKNAGKRAGFSEVEILKEPVASLLYYGEDFLSKKNGVYFVADLGGGTYDISIIKVDNEKYDVLATGGHSALGGDNFTDVIVRMINDEILNNAKYGLLNFDQENIDHDSALQITFNNSQLLYKKTKNKILKAAENAKIELSSLNSFNIEIPELFMNRDLPVSFEYEITREDFEKNAECLINKFKTVTLSMLDNVNKDEIDSIILVGGSINIPIMKETIKSIFDKEPLDKHLDTVVAMGACMKANKDIRIDNRINYNIGEKQYDGSIEIIIPAQSEYPICQSKKFSTVEDDQTYIDFDIYEGNYLEDASNSNNHFIGTVRISDLKKEKAGIPIISLTLSIDKDGMLTVTAMNLKNKKNVKSEIINWAEIKF